MCSKFLFFLIYPILSESWQIYSYSLILVHTVFLPVMKTSAEFSLSCRSKWTEEPVASFLRLGIHYKRNNGSDRNSQPLKFSFLFFYLFCAYIDFTEYIWNRRQFWLIFDFDFLFLLCYVHWDEHSGSNYRVMLSTCDSHKNISFQQDHPHLTSTVDNKIGYHPHCPWKLQLEHSLIWPISVLRKS